MYNLRPRKKTARMNDDDISDHDSDPDYDPDYESSSDEEEEIDTEDEEEYDLSELGRNYRMGSSAPCVSFICPVLNYNPEEKDYLSKINLAERKRLTELEEQLGNSISKELIPLRFRILQSQMDDSSKRHILHKLNQFAPMNDTTGEYFKLKNWLENVTRLPLGKFASLPVSNKDPLDKIRAFMENTLRILEETVYGHKDTKLQIMRIVAQWISNPSSYGHAIGIYGPPGVGKTQLIKNGLSKALGLPFGFIPLGGCSDGSFLEGHSYTYEGSTYGKITEVLIKTQCNNPILFFDELDKVSATKKGDEIIGLLTHLTDPTQNEKFTDKYFTDIDINLSRSLIIFSYNDNTVINPILKDRLITIKVDGYKKPEKRIIAKDYLFPEICKAYGFSSSDILLDDDSVDYIIDTVPEEQGVRNLKRGLENVISWINMERWQPNSTITFPYKITTELVQKYVYKSDHNLTHPSMYT